MPPWILTLDGEEVEPLPRDVIATPELAERFRLLIDDVVIAVPPLDELSIYGGLPEIPDATLHIHYEVTDSPIGTVRVLLDLVDGQMVRSEVVSEYPERDDATVFVSIGWDRHLDFRSGRATVLEALEGARIEARWQTLLLAHGLLQQEEWTTPLHALPVVGPR
jgi:hypothetical protein